MIHRRLWISLIGIVTVAVLLLAANLLSDNQPVLGLDLQGGVSVVLSTEEGATADDLAVIRDLIRDELEGRGIAEPDVRVEGQNVIVDLPGVRDQRDALDAVDVAGIVQLRPVMQQCTPPIDETATGSSVPESSGVESSAPETSVPESSVRESTNPTESSVVDSTSPGTATTASPSGFRGASSPGTSAPATTEPGDSTTPRDSSTPESSAPTESSEPAPTTSTEPPLGPVGPNPVTTYPPTPYGPPPPPTDDSTIELPNRDGWTCLVGPVERGPSGESGGQLFARGSASAQLDPAQGWIVSVDPTSEGRGTFNQLATACFTKQQNCPLGQLAIVLDDVIQSAPVVQDASFPGRITISGGGASSFSESEARSLARVLDRGAFPVQVRTESVQTVSPTLGDDSLQAAIFAALLGVVLVLLGLMYFYRRMIVVVMAGLAVWGLLIYSASAIISQTTNYALSLAGVTGIIVAVGITVDSYVVYFERLKEEVRHGRTVRNSALRSFKTTWRTIIAADFVSLIAAAVLFALSIGSVRGFALYLGVTTVCDLIVCWFFTRPAVALLADNGWLDQGDTFGLKDYE
jgi:preprotein translocase subunit SecD